jgi:hypothetical protein
MSEPSAAQAGQRTREELLGQAGAELLDVEGWVAPDRPGGQVRGGARYMMNPSAELRVFYVYARSAGQAAITSAGAMARVAPLGVDGQRELIREIADLLAFRAPADRDHIPRVLSSGRRPRGASPRWPTNLPHRLERRR